MQLTDDERAMLDGYRGRARQKAMDLLIRYGEALGAAAERLGCRLRFMSRGVVLGSRRFVEAQGARVRRLVAGAEPGGAVAGGWYVWRRGRAVPVEASG